MVAFVLRRLLQSIPTLIVIATLTFFAVRIAPGGPFSSERNVSPEVIRRLERHYGLDRPILLQYAAYLGKAVRGDLGPSYRYPTRSVNDLIAESFPVSLQLGALAMLIALAAGLGGGIVASLKPNSLSDHAAMSAAMVGICLPTFVLGPLLVLLFGLKLGWVNVAGWETLGDRILPALTLAAPFAAYIARLARGGMLEILPQDFIRTARAKGVPESQVILRHALRGGLLPVVSFLGPALAGIITGSFVVETIFQIPGLGRYFVTAAFNRDYFMIQGTVVFYGMLIIAFNMMVDIAIAALDPRVRTSQ